MQYFREKNAEFQIPQIKGIWATKTRRFPNSRKPGMRKHIPSLQGGVCTQFDFKD
jgi:hypothetical protein